MTVITAKVIQSMSQKQRDQFLKDNNELGIQDKKYLGLHASVLAKFLASDQKLRSSVEAIDKEVTNIEEAQKALFADDKFADNEFLSSLSENLKKLVQNLKLGESSEGLSEESAKALKEKLSNLGLDVNEKTETNDIVTKLNTYLESKAVTDKAYEDARKIELSEGVDFEDAAKLQFHINLLSEISEIADLTNKHKGLVADVDAVELTEVGGTDAQSNARWELAKVIYSGGTADYDSLEALNSGKKTVVLIEDENSSAEESTKNQELIDLVENIDSKVVAQYMLENTLDKDAIGSLLNNAYVAGISDVKEEVKSCFVGEKSPEEVSGINAFIEKIIASESIDTKLLTAVKSFKEKYSALYDDELFCEKPEVARDALNGVKLPNAAFKPFVDVALKVLREDKIKLESAVRSELKEKYGSLTSDKVLSIIFDGESSEEDIKKFKGDEDSEELINFDKALSGFSAKLVETSVASADKYSRLSHIESYLSKFDTAKWWQVALTDATFATAKTNRLGLAGLALLGTAFVPAFAPASAYLLAGSMFMGYTFSVRAIQQMSAARTRSLFRPEHYKAVGQDTWSNWAKRAFRLDAKVTTPLYKTAIAVALPALLAVPAYTSLVFGAMTTAMRSSVTMLLSACGLQSLFSASTSIHNHGYDSSSYVPLSDLTLSAHAKVENDAVNDKILAKAKTEIVKLDGLSIETFKPEKGETVSDERTNLTGQLQSILNSIQAVITKGDDEKVSTTLTLESYNDINDSVSKISSKQVSSYSELSDVYNKIVKVISDPKLVECNLIKESVNQAHKDAKLTQEDLERGLIPVVSK